MIEEIKQEAQQKMSQAIAHAQSELLKVRTGRANPEMFNSIDDNETVVGIPGRIVRKKAEDTDSFDSYAASSSGISNDPTLQAVNSLIDRLSELEEKLDKVSSKKSSKKIEKN